MQMKRLAVLTALGIVMVGLTAFYPIGAGAFGVAANGEKSGTPVTLDTEEKAITLYNFQGKRSISRFDKGTGPALKSAYAHVFFRAGKDKETFDAIVKRAGIRRVDVVFVEEDGKAFEKWTANLLGQDPGAVKDKLAADFPTIFFNLEPYTVEDKLTEKMQGLKEFEPHQKDQLTGKVFANVHFFSDVPESVRDSILKAHIPKEDFSKPPLSAKLRGYRDNLRKLAMIDQVSLVEEADSILAITNNMARAQTRVSNAQPSIDTSISAPTTAWLNNAPYSGYYFGRGVWVGVYDTGIDTVNNTTSADDFKERFSGTTARTRMANTGIFWHEGTQGAGNEGDIHGSHVAGIIGGNGWNSSGSGGPRYFWRGVAPKSLFISGSIANLGFDGHVNNHSHVSGFSGTYETGDRDIDNLVNDHSTTRTMVYAAANNGLRNQYGAQRGYYSLLVNSKNAITVGAVYKDTALRANFSSMGPSRDGRIKPDVVAPGASYRYPNRQLMPMSVEIDYIRIRRPTNVTAKAWEFNSTCSGSDCWGNQDYTTNHQTSGGVMKFNSTWVGGWISNTGISGYSTNANDTLIIRYRMKHPQIPGKLTRLQCGISWGTFNANFDSLRFTLPTPDTTNFQTFKARLRDLRGYFSETDIFRNGPARWPTGTGIPVTQMFLFFGNDTSVAMISSNTQAANAPRYIQAAGTSMAAPHVTGIAALLLEKWAAVVRPGANLHTQGPWNSTVKALLVHTATDLIKTQPDQWEVGIGADGILSVNPDLCGTDPVTFTCTRPGATAQNSIVKYYAGPDYATGYGLVNAEKALAYTVANRIVQDSVRFEEGVKSYTFTVPSGVSSLRVTLAWDDLGGDAAQPINARKLVSDLNLSLLAPNGTVYHPWVLNPLPQNIVGNQPPANGLDPIDSVHIQAAYKGVNFNDNVEVVDVAPGGTLPSGTWRIIVRVNAIPMGIKQDFSLVTDYTPTKLAHTIGWIRRAGPCPEGEGSIFLHDESTSNGTFAYFRNTGTTGPWSTWTSGGIYKAGQDKTGIQFCRESFHTLPQTRNPYAVLKLSGSCPANGHSFARISDNEDTNNANSNSGNIAPSTQSSAPGHGLTTMWFCYVKGDGSSGDPPWKSRGHGAWASVGQTVNGGCDQMHWHLQDDENSGNANYFGWNQLANQADSTQIKANIFNNSSFDTGYLWNACQ